MESRADVPRWYNHNFFNNQVMYPLYRHNMNLFFLSLRTLQESRPSTWEMYKANKRKIKYLSNVDFNNRLKYLTLNSDYTLRNFV